MGLLVNAFVVRVAVRVIGMAFVLMKVFLMSSL